MRLKFIFPVLILLTVFHCHKDEPLQEAVEGPRFVVLEPGSYPILEDSYDRDSLVRAIDRQLKWLRENGNESTWSFGKEVVDAARIEQTLTFFKQIWLESWDKPKELRKKIGAAFHVYRLEWMAGPDMLITGYHSPILSGSLERTKRFRFPLYGPPADRILIRPSLFHPGFLQAGPALRSDKVVGRIKRETGEVVPYYSRSEIDRDNVLSDRGLELVYLDDYFDAFLFHVQGGGFIRLEDGRYLKLNYAGKNGRPYTSIGKLLVSEGKIPETEISIQAIERYFAQFPGELERVCMANESYVFYETDGRLWDQLEPDMYPTGILGFPVTPKRSIALDKRYFPGGALGFVAGSQRDEKGGARKFSAFVVDQDTGGAIKNAHLDFYHGAGSEAESDAGLLKDDHGRLYFILIKEKSPGT